MFRHQNREISSANLFDFYSALHVELFCSPGLIFISNLVSFFGGGSLQGPEAQNLWKWYFGWRLRGIIRPPTSPVFQLGNFECVFASNDILILCSYPFLWLFYFVGDESAPFIYSSLFSYLRF